MPTGKIKFYNEDRGFGKIQRPGKEDLFFHVHACEGFTPAVGMRVDFVEGMGKKGPAATQVSAVQGSGAKSPAPNHTPAQATASPNGDLLVPQDTAAAAQAALAQASNPALLLDRYIDAAAIADQKGQRDSLQRVIDTNARIDPEHYRRTITHLEAGIPAMLLQTKSRLAIQLSRAAGLENANCCLHPVHGFPYLPGSGLKGLAHAYACHLYYCKNEATRLRDTEGIDCQGDTGPWKDLDEKERFIQTIENLFGWAPNTDRQGKPSDWDPRAGRHEARDPTQQRGAVIFHDAFADGAPAPLDMDICTPHYDDYYKDGTTAPGDWLSPNPITFLTIAAGTTFRFRVSGDDQALVNVAKRLLLGGLHWLGAGAKTAAGYGWFEDSWQRDPEQERQEKLQRAQEQAADTKQRLQKLHQELKPGEVLFVPNQANDRSRSGHILTPDEGTTWSGAPASFGKKYKKNSWTIGQMIIATQQADGQLSGPWRVADATIPLFTTPGD